jgi:O-acetyl-ADP-ribose deacetylase
LKVVTADITTLDVDAIVNAANEDLIRGGGVCGAIFRAAGPQLDHACRALAPCPAGDALLASAYQSALQAAAQAGARSIAFPAISTGIYGYPREAAADVAIAAVREWRAAAQNTLDVIFCAFNEGDAQLYRARLA